MQPLRVPTISKITAAYDRVPAVLPANGLLNVLQCGKRCDATSPKAIGKAINRKHRCQKMSSEYQGNRHQSQNGQAGSRPEHLGSHGVDSAAQMISSMGQELCQKYQRAVPQHATFGQRVVFSNLDFNACPLLPYRLPPFEVWAQSNLSPLQNSAIPAR